MPSGTIQLPTNPMLGMSFVSKYITFRWLNKLFKRGYKYALSNEDFYQVPPADSAERVTDKLERYWNREKEKAKKSKRKPHLRNAVIHYLGTEYLLLSLMHLFEETLRITTPYLIGRLISYFTPETTTTKTQAYLYALGIISFSFCGAIIHHPNFFLATRYGMQLRIALGTLVYKKAMQVSQSGFARVSTGHIVNLVTSDVQILERVTLFLSQVVSAPILLIVTGILSWNEIGIWSLPGLIILILLAPFQAWLGKNFALLRHKTAAFTDQRFKVMNEVISGMRVIKMYNWEEPFSHVVADVRRQEVNVIRKAANLKGINGIIYSMSIPIVALAIFVPYVMLGNSLTPEKLFTVLGIFYSVRVTIAIFFPECIRGVKEGLVSIGRIQNFLQMEDKKSVNEKQYSADPPNPLVEVQNITAQWNMALSTPTLQDITFTVKPGELFMVVGPVGSGKSSLLSVLLGELPVLQGNVQVQGKVSYASQQSWIFSGTVRDNILFDQEFDEQRYKKIIKVCALEKDLKLFPNGDQTLVGERGVALSGGQKARINLARTSYCKSDVVLLDDPLSAVDTHVGRHLFDKCICGLLKGRIVILVTHQLQYLKGSTNILCLQDGRCVGQGTLEDLSERGLDVTSLMSLNTMDVELPTTPSPGDQILQDPFEVIVTNCKAPLLGPKTQVSMETVAPSLRLGLKQRSVSELSAAFSMESLQQDVVEEEPAMKPDAEVQVTGTVTWRVYWDYFKAGNSIPGLICIAFFVLATQAIVLVGEWWLAEWADREDYVSKALYNTTIKSAALTSLSRDTYVIIFGALVAGGLVLSCLSCILLFHVFVDASQNLHNNMFSSVLKTPMYFFDTNPVGRVLNRFAKDISQMDDLLPSAFNDFIRLSLLTFSILLLNVASIPYLLVGVVPMVALFGYIRNYYLSTSRDIKRLEAINRSPMYSHLSSSLDGLITIRAFDAQRRFIDTFYEYMDFHSSSYFLFLTTQRWLGFRLDVICALFMAMATLGSLVTLETGTAISASVVGLCLTYTKMLTGMFQWCLRQSAEVETLMTSVERVIEYAHLEPEQEVSKPMDVPQTWPDSGVITAEELYYSHHKSLPFVLKNLNFTIKAEEKVGIVGRTGAGKSSLLAVLFRLNNPQGVVRIDSIPITDIMLHDLRSAISIIPQDPVLFSGTLRKNLDPFGDYSDEDLWNALEEVQLKEAIEELPDGVDTLLAEAGSNFSVGQRQLICLARAILSHNKILVIDEATANVDQDTDSLIQETIRHKFRDCTVLTIAHRLNTIMDSDRVMVLDEGRLVEFEEPFLLLQQKNSVFTQLVEQTGAKSSASLRETARQAYELRRDPGNHDDIGKPGDDITSLVSRDPNCNADKNDGDDNSDSEVNTSLIRNPKDDEADKNDDDDIRINDVDDVNTPLIQTTEDGKGDKNDGDDIIDADVNTSLIQKTEDSKGDKNDGDDNSINDADDVNTPLIQTTEDSEPDKNDDDDDSINDADDDVITSQQEVDVKSGIVD